MSAVALAAVACGSAGPRSAPSRPSTTAVAATVTTFGGIVGAGSAQACRQDAALVDEASTAYQAKHGQPAPSLQALQTDGELREVPATGHGYTISYDPATGRVTANGACTGP